MKEHLNLMAQIIGIIVNTGLTKNTNIVQEEIVNLPGIAVRCGLSSRGLIGLSFFEETVTDQTYLQMLEIMIPRLNDLFEIENEVYFQQDGDPPHFHVNVRHFLDRTFNQKWRGRRGSATEFPPRSPDLTPLDFYLRGTVNNTVYATKPQTMEELRDQIEHAINPDGMSLCSTSLLGVYCSRWKF